MEGSLRRNAEWWRSWCTSRLVLSVVEHGYQLRWEKQAPTPRLLRNLPGAHTHASFVTKSISDLLECGAIVEWPAGSRPCCVSPLNVVEQPTKLRLILDLRHVNKALKQNKFEYEGLERVPQVVRTGDWLFSLDLKSGYHHVDIHKDSWTYLGFEWEGRFYAFRCLPFGLADAPFIFTMVIRQLARRWRTQGIRMIPYVDDFLFAAVSRARAREICALVRQDLKNAGFNIHPKKSVLAPTRELRFLGVLVNSKDSTLTIPADRCSVLQVKLESLIAAGDRQQRVHIRQVASVAGILASMRPALGPLSRAMSQGLINTINDASNWGCNVRLSDEALSDLKFWKENLDKLNGAPFRPHASFDAVIHTDASDVGWGAELLILGGEQHAASGHLETLEGASSTARELFGVLEALRTFAPRIINQNVLVRTDNTSVFFILRRGGSGKEELTKLCSRVMHLCVEHGVHLSVEWIPRAENEYADYMSRAIESDDWGVQPAVFAALASEWGNPSVDLFATPANAQVPRYVSRYAYHGCAAVDAFSIPWGNEFGYACPPPALIPGVLTHAQKHKAKLILVIPAWTHSLWWPWVTQDATTWHPATQDILYLGTGADCLRVGTHTLAFGGRGYPNSDILALLMDFTHPLVLPLSLSRPGCPALASAHGGSINQG